MNVSKKTRGYVFTAVVEVLFLFLYAGLPLMAGTPGEKPEPIELPECVYCCSAINSLNLAYGNLESAISKYKPVLYNCEIPPWGMPDPRATFMNAALGATDTAVKKAKNACDFCDCSVAKGAYNSASQALSYTKTAISSTKNKCDPDAPWLGQLTMAKKWLSNAVNKLANCKNDACN